MRTEAMRWSLACAALTGIGGCGTILNMHDRPWVPTDEPPRQVYGGVKIDNKFGTQFRQRDPEGGEYDLSNAALWVATVVDLPLSAIGDTLTLPLILWWQSHTPGKGEQPVSVPSSPPAATVSGR
jgi:uncharacterized protein YceK